MNPVLLVIVLYFSIAATTFEIKNSKESDVSSAVGTWLAQSGDREGGRKKRHADGTKKDDSNNNLNKSIDETLRLEEDNAENV